MEAESICIHPVPFCMAMLFSCRSYTITHHLAVILLGGVMHTSVSTCRCTLCLHPLLMPIPMCSSSPAPNQPLSSCAGITPHVCDSSVSGCWNHHM